MGLKNYLFGKLIFPKVFIIDQPGIIINKTIGRFGKEGVKTRVVYNFEYIAVNLYLETVKKIGKKKTDDLWYRIGKERGKKNFLFFFEKKKKKTVLAFIFFYIFFF